MSLRNAIFRWRRMSAWACQCLVFADNGLRGAGLTIEELLTPMRLHCKPERWMRTLNGPEHSERA